MGEMPAIVAVDLWTSLMVIFVAVAKALTGCTKKATPLSIRSGLV